MNVMKLTECVSESGNDDAVAKNLGDFNKKVKCQMAFSLVILDFNPGVDLGSRVEFVKLFL